MQISRQFIAETVILGLMLLLVWNIYTWWIGLFLTIIVIFLIFTRIRSTVIIPTPTFNSKELITGIDFKDDTGKLVHVTKEQLIKPLSSSAKEFIDSGLVGTGKIGSFKSSLLINKEWKEIETPLTTELKGAELSVISKYEPPLSKDWIWRRFEFDCIDCFLEKEESFVLRVDNQTDLFKVTFNFHPKRSPELMTIYEVIGSHQKELKTIRPTSPQQPTVFQWSKRGIHLASEYLFIWKW